MGKIYCIMGKSSSGKDTMLKAVRKRLPDIRSVTLYTTRPVRDGERDGEEYFFISEEILDTYEKQGRVIEQRAYDTVHGIWRYAMLDDGQIDLARADYLVIGTLESYRRMRAYYGQEYVAPVYIEVEDGERLTRALERERCQEIPRYAELCRRFLADTADYSEENLEELGITRRYLNHDGIQCLEEIIGEIQHGKL